MKFQFSIREALNASWQTFWRHGWFFGGMALITFLLGLFKDEHRVVITALVIIAQILWSYVWHSASLAAVDGKEDLLNFKHLSSHMPNFRQFLVFIAIALLTVVIVGVGFVLLIIPGIYFGVRLAFGRLAYVDHQNSIKKSFEQSWHMVKGKIFWMVLLVFLVEILTVAVGFLVVFIGLIVAYPIAVLLFARLYCALDNHQRIAVTTETSTQ